MTTGPQLFRIDDSTRKSERIEEVEFSQLGFRERRDIQEWIADNPSILGEGLFIIAKEFSGFDRTNERLDLLAVDVGGRLVVIELKRDDTGTDAHWQAIKYASYLRDAKPEALVRMLAAHLSTHEEVSEKEAQEKLLEHLGTDDLNALNNDQRIILASHRFAPEVTSAALWLNEKAPDENLITCIQLTPYQDEKTNTLYVQANTIIPVPGADDYRVGIGGRREGREERGSSSFAVNLKKTYDRNRSDEVTHFLRGAADLAVKDLPDETRPNKRSRWAGEWGDLRYYRVWYKRPPWRNWGLTYNLHLSSGGEPVPWKVRVEFGSYTDELKSRLEELDVPGRLKNRIEELDVPGELLVRQDRILMTHNAKALDEPFAETLAATLRSFIEEITPVVHQFEEERNEEEA